MTHRHSTNGIAVMLLLTFVLLSGFALAVAPNVTYINPDDPTNPVPNVTVDGSYTTVAGEWDLTNDFFKGMWIAGDDTKQLLSKSYLKYDCNTQTMYVLVLKESGTSIDGNAEAWVRIRQNKDDALFEDDGVTEKNPIVQESTGDDGTPPDFTMILNGATEIGYEASFKVRPGVWDIEMHMNINGNTSSSGKFAQGTPTPLVIECGEVKLGDKVWYDKDENGIQDVGEPGVAGVRVTLYEWDGTTGTQVGQPVTTDAAGTYLFRALDPGDYYVTFSNLPSQYIGFTTKDAGSNEAKDSDAGSGGQTDPVTLVEDQTYLDLDAGLITDYGSIGDVVWLDQGGDDPVNDDANGVQDAGEGGIDGVTVELYKSDNTFVESMETANGGKYLFDELPTGTYYIKIQVPPDYSVSPLDQGGNDATDSDISPSTSKSANINLTTPRTDTRVWDAGIYYNPPQYVLLGDRVWIDKNSDNQQTAGEPGLAGVTVELLLNGSATGYSDVTDGLGLWEIKYPVTSGNHSLRFTLPSGMTFVTQNIGGEEVDSDVEGAGSSNVGTTTTFLCNTVGSYKTWDAGVVDNALGSIGDYVWLDADAQGDQDETNAGLGGITVQLLNGSGTVLSTTTTNSAGYYLFDELAAGNYRIKVLPGSYSVSPKDATSDALDSDIDPNDDNRTGIIALSAGADITTVDAGLYIPTGFVTIGDRVWLDQIANDVQDANEVGVAGVVVSLLVKNGSKFDPTGYSATTDENGYYQITVPNAEITSTDYKLTFTPAGSETFVEENIGGDDTKDSDPYNSGGSKGETVAFTLSPSGTYMNWDAGVVDETGSIGNFVWNDVDQDGIQETGEVGINGITVMLVADDKETVLRTTVTTDGGYYLFDNVPAGDYHIRVNPGNYSVSPRGAAADDIDSDVTPIQPYQTPFSAFTLSAGENDMSWDIGLFNAAKEKVILGDYVWFDANENGIQEQGEVPLEGVIVELINNTGRMGSGVTAVTDENGIWRIEADVDPNTSAAYNLIFYPPDAVNPHPDDPMNSWEGSPWFVTYKHEGTNEDVDSDASNGDSNRGQTDNGTVILLEAGVFLNFDCGMNIQDFGDAYTPWQLQVDNTSDPTRAAQLGTAFIYESDGGSHTILPNFSLGASVDADPDGHDSEAADGDDTETTADIGDVDPGDDENGATFLATNGGLPKFVQGRPTMMTVNLNNPTGLPAYLDVFIDYNGINGWVRNTTVLNTERLDEHVVSGLELSPGNNSVLVDISDDIPALESATYFDTYMRLRLSTQGNVPAWSHVIDGEVEDYKIRIMKDTDGDGVDDDSDADDGKYYPSGWIYDENTGLIISGGYITVTGGPAGAQVIIAEDGSKGYFEFYVTMAGTYTMTYTPPEGWNLSSICDAGSPALDPTGLGNPYILGENPDLTLSGRKLPDYTCTSNPYYFTFDLDPGDPVIQLNNIPVTDQDPISVNLTSFAAVEKDGQVDVSWSVESEDNTAGYNLYRKADGDKEYTKVNADVIKSAGETDDVVYHYLDTPPSAGKYWYMLEVVSLDGQTEELGTIVTTVMSSVETNVIPKEFALYQNYPNPFNPTTTIKYDLPKDSYVTIDIYDILGNRVKRLVHDNIQAGAHSVVWDATNDFGSKVSTGIYMYRITAGDFSKIHKMILMK